MKKPRKMSKQDRLYNNLYKVVCQYMGGRSFSAVTEKELMERLSLLPEHQPLLRKVLQQLIKEGRCKQKKDRFLAEGSKETLVTGIIRMHHRGFGFVEPDQGSLIQEEIFIPKAMTYNAVDSDTVEVQVNPVVSEKGPEGRVIAIIKRGRTHIAGTIRKIDPLGDSIAYAPLLGNTQKVVVQAKDKSDRLAVGDRVIMEVIDWGDQKSETLCRLSHKIGHISDPSCDVAAAIEEFDLRGEFPSEVIKEAQAFGKTVPQAAIQEREDLRDLDCITIDPDTAKDFDDALSLTVSEDGNFHLGVHIADVSHYVQEGSLLDKEAKERANSTYFPSFCLPMLPHELSSNLCSLKPNVNRLTISTLMEFNPEGELVNYRITRSVIKSKKRFTYREAYAILQEKKKSPFAPLLKQMESLCYALKSLRFKRGSHDLALSELVVIVDETGMPTHTDLVEYDITHQMVEEFMLKTNETIALHLDKLEKNLTFRVHDEPLSESIREFVSLARSLGFDLPDNPDHNELQKLFNEAAKTPFGQHLLSSYIRKMKMAYYSPDNIGHFGLSLTHYCHFTSPIRRYADLIVHRILFGDSDNYEALQKISDHCSEQERLSAKAENHVHLLKKLRLLQAMREENPEREFLACITEVKPFGIVIDVLELRLDTFIHISELGEDFYTFEERRMRLYGIYTGTTLGVGEELFVQIKEIDLITLECKWQLALEEVEEIREQKKKKGKKKRR